MAGTRFPISKDVREGNCTEGIVISCQLVLLAVRVKSREREVAPIGRGCQDLLLTGN